MRLRVAYLAVAATAVASLANAQAWSVQSGATGRLEYNDNYFFVPVDTQSAFTASITPFLTAARRTETSDVTALIAVGANEVWGDPPAVNYLSGRFDLDGSVREARSTWAGKASFVRSADLQNQASQAGAPLVLAYTNAASMAGAYTYAMTERWSLGATVGAYGNRYEAVESDAALSNNHGFYASGNVGYAYSERTLLTFVTGYTFYDSSVARGSGVTTTIGAVHQFSPQLTISASAGGFWSNTEASDNSLAGGNHRRDSGGLFGGSLTYLASERTQVGASLSENLTPSSSGTLNKADIASAALTHQFSERLTGRLGGSYTRTIIPATTSKSITNSDYSGGIGLTYVLAERWQLDAGYRYTGARYEQTAGAPKSNVVFLSIGYNWPGASFTEWVGRRSDMQGPAGAGAVSLPVRGPESPPLPGVPPAASSPGAAPFDQLTIP